MTNSHTLKILAYSFPKCQGVWNLPSSQHLEGTAASPSVRGTCLKQVFASSARAVCSVSVHEGFPTFKGCNGLKTKK